MEIRIRRAIPLSLAFSGLLQLDFAGSFGFFKSGGQRQKGGAAVLLLHPVSRNRCRREESNVVLFSEEQQQRSTLLSNESSRRPPQQNVSEDWEDCASVDVHAPSSLGNPFASQQQQHYRVPDDDSDRHLAIVMAGTLWWYLYTSYTMLQLPSTNDLFLGLSNDLTRQTLAIFVTASQLLVYGGCYRLARAQTLLEAQWLVVGMTALCVPADLIATLVNPTGSKGITIAAFAEITFFFGVFLAHYLRKASYREIPPSTVESTASTSTSSSSFSSRTKQQDRSSDHHGGILETLIYYRPPMGIQATHMATDFTRSFVAFTIAAGSVGEQFLLHQNNGPATEPLDPSSFAIGSLIVVVLHTAAECTLTTVFPGANLQQYTSYLVAEIVLYSIHMFAASIVTIQADFGTGLIDQALFIWLFGSATAKVINKLSVLIGRIDLDAKLGLSNLDSFNR